ncbi:MAG: HEPN domain-containing protein [DPANN group archaeon]|nr:HEPN domain-containing protein [DPANN group archaeon]
MDEKRILEAKKNYHAYLSEYLLKKVPFDQNIFEKFQENAIESLTVANELFESRMSYLWTIVVSYYAMFYIASAYIYRKGFKAQHKIVHKVINDTLIILAKDELEKRFLEEYEEEKEKALTLAENMLDSFEHERTKRSTFQYEMTKELKESKARTSLERAKDFVNMFRELIQ